MRLETEFKNTFFRGRGWSKADDIEISAWPALFLTFESDPVYRYTSLAVHFLVWRFAFTLRTKNA